ncbi:hypothetical protein H6S82_32235 [Planktothrix sp. FACHB-1355]|uniref:Uncharacterized protein n=1 Tax=Aerosakkonema funiforme FACHB-1375 TaxID=2949571 RepID=A0A926VKH1_9CYAN|nr:MULTISPECIES: hypothetical protein [Oscillatoriales]MBD2185546.1 hypothetical protein [Aerosakkonema funiforme FACHB-1375]MBD3563475.1 hypothetical protein [Planktothrix sp. FACHB-1355]
MITIAVTHNAANVIGMLSQQAIKTLKQAEFCVVKQEGDYGFTGSLTIPLLPEEGLTWQGVKSCLENSGYQVLIVC